MKHTPDQIINNLRQVEVELAKGATMATVRKKLEMSDHNYYRWRSEYGEIRVDQARRLKQLEQENTRLKQLVADQALGIYPVYGIID